MEVMSRARFVRISPKKARLLVNAIRGLPVGEVLNRLKFTPKKAAVLLSKVVSSAVANISQRSAVDVDNLYVKRVFVDEGSTLKRWRPRAMGRAFVIRKRTSHITVIIDER